MTSGDQQPETPDVVLRRVAKHLAPRSLSRMIDHPVDAALSEFRFTWDDNQSTRGMLQQAARLLGSIQAHFDSSFVNEVLEAEWIKDEAYHVLDQNYEGDHGCGFSAAVFDMVSTPRVLRPGIDTVLIGLGDAIKARWRQRWTDHVLSSELSSRPFAERRRIASLILDRWSRDLPEEIACGSPGKWAGELPGLVLLLMDNIAVRETIFDPAEEATPLGTTRSSQRPVGVRREPMVTACISRYASCGPEEGVS